MSGVQNGAASRPPGVKLAAATVGIELVSSSCEKCHTARVPKCGAKVTPFREGETLRSRLLELRPTGAAGGTCPVELQVQSEAPYRWPQM